MSIIASTLFSIYAFFSASFMLFRELAKRLIPTQLRPYLRNPPSSNLTLIINEYSALKDSSGLNNGWRGGSGTSHNQVFEAAEVYLPTMLGPSNNCLQASKTPHQRKIKLAMEKDEEVEDTFEDIKLKWRFSCVQRHFELTFHKQYIAIVTESYLPYVLRQAKAIKEREHIVKLYYGVTVDGQWRSISLLNPATFEAMAMEPELKRTVIEDLDMFVRRKKFYRNVGKCWKRGYLLYGPPGTGKSSLVAAMANYLKFDVYDLDLASVHSNSQLRNALLATTNRSVLVIKNIDFTHSIVDLKKHLNMQYGGYSSYPEYNDQKLLDEKITLPGLLNLIDGLWLSGEDERIIVFTTNHKDKLDPVLLSPGRMDLHIHLSYCTPSGFKTLASNYLDIQESNPHPLCGEIERLMETTEVTPAEIAEELMKSDDADVALEGVVNLLKCKMEG